MYIWPLQYTRMGHVTVLYRSLSRETVVLYGGMYLALDVASEAGDGDGGAVLLALIKPLQDDLVEPTVCPPFQESIKLHQHQNHIMVTTEQQMPPRSNLFSSNSSNASERHLLRC